MKVMGLDISSRTGYCLLEDGNLINYGMLDLLPDMNLYQRINFFENNINKILNDYNPDYVAIEDVLLGISGAKTLAYLARLNGIAISCCYKKVHNNIQLFMPSEWKANSFDGLNGIAKKVDIQIAVCRHYNLIEESKLKEIIKPLDDTNIQCGQYEQSIITLTQDTKKYIAFLNRKRNGFKNDVDRKAFENKISENKQKIQQFKDYIKQCKLKVDNIYKNVSLEISGNCGLTQDQSDSIGIAYCLWKKLKNN